LSNKSGYVTMELVGKRERPYW